MQARLMHLNMKWTTVLNPGQTPIDVNVQAILALTRQLQFCHPENLFSVFSHLRATSY